MTAFEKPLIHRSLEYLILFFLLPLSFTLSYPIWIKMVLTILGFGYIMWILFKKEKQTFKIEKGINWSSFWKETLVIFLAIVVITTTYVWYVQPESLFYVPLKKPGLYIAILFIYTFLSVWPQEVIYRTFYTKRYEHWFKSKALFVFVNGIIFSLAHIFFRNTLVLILTFIGGMLFALNYLKYRSTTLVSIQHALYGNWLFTVGMGEMLAFPGMEQP